jgi:hypothetical protein
MYQDHQHTITRYVSQPCTKACTKPSTCTIPSINHVPQQSTMYHQPNCASTMHQHLYQTMHQPCTNTCTKPCINHAPQPVPNHASTMHQHLYQTMHQPCTITCTICLNHQPCTSTPYQVPIMYHTMYQPCTSTSYTCTIPCTNNVSQPYTISLNHAIHHVP